ncbi:hypothetical protein [Rhodoflexus sp.]
MISFLIGLWALLLFAPSNQALTFVSNQCDQSYRLLFKEKERDLFWIAENIYGECSQSNLIQIDLSSLAVHTRVTPIKEFDRWGVLEQALKHSIDYELPIEIMPRNGVLSLDLIGIKLRTPERHKQFEQMYRKDFSSECARQWNEGMGLGGIVLPVASGNIAPKLLYASPNGLYFNYQIDRAYYFADSRLIIIFTKNNEFRCNGDVASMHGFLILRIGDA